jgi:hypothetical protein
MTRRKIKRLLVKRAGLVAQIKHLKDAIIHEANAGRECVYYVNRLGEAKRKIAELDERLRHANFIVGQTKLP